MAKLTLRERFKQGAAGSGDSLRGSKFASSIFRPGSPLEKDILTAQETDHM
jgi:hypothetical protein